MDQDPFSQWRSGRLKKEALARKVLGVDERCAPGSIRKAYHRLALKYHPDRNPADLVAADRFVNVNKAYRVLVKGVDDTLADFPEREDRPPIDPKEAARDYMNWWMTRFPY